MSKKRLKDYLLRTLSYYQAEGGVYSEIITILLKIRHLPRYRALPLPARILNEAVYYWDMMREGKDCADWALMDEVKSNPLIMSVIACLSAAVLDEGWFITQELKGLLADDSQYYPHFVSVVEKYEKEYEEAYAELHGEAPADIIKRQDEKIMFLEGKLADRDDIILKQDATLAELSSSIDRLKEEIKAIDLEQQKAKEGYYGAVSDFDRYLSLETILEWIKSRQHYVYTEHVFRMLADMKDNRATDEERERIKQLEAELLGKNVSNTVVNTNYAFGSNLMTGIAQSPWMPIGMNPEELTDMFEKFLKSLSDGQGQV